MSWSTGMGGTVVHLHHSFLFYSSHDIFLSWVLLRRPPLSVAPPPIFTATPPYTKDAPCTSTLNYFGMFVMTLHYGRQLKLAPSLPLVKVIVKQGAHWGPSV